MLSGATGCSEAPCIPPGQQVGLMNRKRRGTAARHDRRPHVWRAGVGRAAGRVGAGSGRPATLRSTASSLHQGGGIINGRKRDQPPVIRVIREGPARHGSVAGAPKHRQRILSVRRSGWCRNAGPQQWYGRGDPKYSRRQHNGRLPPVSRHPPPIRLLFGVGKRRGGAWVRQFSPPCVPPGHAVSRCSGPTRGSSRRQKPSDLPVRPRPRARVATGRSDCSHRSTGRLFPCKVCCSTRVHMYLLTDAHSMFVMG